MFKVIEDDAISVDSIDSIDSDEEPLIVTRKVKYDSQAIMCLQTYNNDKGNLPDD